MVLYICLVPNRGARIGHQSDDYFKVLTYCKKNHFHFVYHSFTGNSSNFENVLRFKTLHDHTYENTISNIDKVISIDDSVKLGLGNNILTHFIALHASNENILLFDSICGNENYANILNFNLKMDDIIETKRKHRGCLLEYYPKNVVTEYICIHVRCGDIVQDKSRYLSVHYFIDRYNDVIHRFPELKDLPVYIITENNFAQSNVFYERIAHCNIIQTDEISSFYYLVHSTYLIASRSGFSNLAYILGNMKVIKPPNDWNCYFDHLID